jgi:hypothetical protein
MWRSSTLRALRRITSSSENTSSTCGERISITMIWFEDERDRIPPEADVALASAMSLLDPGDVLRPPPTCSTRSLAFSVRSRSMRRYSLSTASMSASTSRALVTSMSFSAVSTRTMSIAMTGILLE